MPSFALGVEDTRTLLRRSRARDENFYGDAVTRAARIDFSNKKVVIYAFTRDLWVTTTSVGFTNPLITTDRLGQVFYEGRNRSTQTDNRSRMLDGTRANSKAIAWPIPREAPLINATRWLINRISGRSRWHSAPQNRRS